jgi:hypothetical protein
MAKPAQIDRLIIWSDDAFAEALKRAFGVENVVVSFEQLKALDFDKRNWKGIVMPIELSWEANSLSRFYGVEFAKTILRAKMKLRLPILFLSFLSLRQLCLDREGKEVLERQIVTAVGHDCLLLPSTPKEWNARLNGMESLTDLQFVDIFNNLCNVRGLIGGAIHKMQGQFRDFGRARENDLNQRRKALFESGLDEIVSLLGGDAQVRKEILLSRFQTEVIEGNSSIQSFLGMCEEELKSLVVEENDGTNNLDAANVRRRPWKVLILDDEPNSLSSLRVALDKRGIECFIAQSVSEAEKAIEEDVFNEIVVAISDYRLLERVDGIQRHQRRQGYDFLFDLAAEDRLTSLIALSGLSRKFLLESFQKYDTKVDVYSKNDLEGEGAINLFADAVLDKGAEAYESLCSRPLGRGWRALKPFYAAHRQSNDRLLNEREISDRACRYVLRIAGIIESKNEELLLQPSLETLENLTADLTHKTPEHTRKSLLVFKNKMVARRIAIWLNLRLRFDRVKIYSALRGRLDADGLHQEIEREVREEIDNSDPDWLSEISKETRKRLKQRIDFLLLTHLAVSLPVSPLEILVEEKRWLKYDMGVENIYDSVEPIEQLYYFVHVGVERWLDSNLSLVQILTEGEDGNLFTKEGQPIVTSIGHAKRILSAIGSALSSDRQRKQYLSLIANIKKNIRANTSGSEDAEEFVEYLNTLSFDRG